MNLFTKHDCPTPLYLNNDKNSFAYVSAKDRWPVILTQVIDDVFKTTRDSTDVEHTAEGKRIVEQLAKLKYELLHDRVMTPLPDDGEKDIELYNQELEILGNPRWFSAPWLYAECYLYRRINTCFTLAETWKNYDIFHRQKEATFKSSLSAVLELAHKYQELVTGLSSQTEETHSGEAEKILFIEMCEICLWGNATDLSLLTTLTYDDIQKLQGADARKKAEKNILVNDLPQVYSVLKSAQQNKPKDAERRVDIILDNSGFELFVDLILAGYLLSTGLATNIVLHPKSLPWFVSDVLPADFVDLLNALNDPRDYFESHISNNNNNNNSNNENNDSNEHSNSDAIANPIKLSETQISSLKFLFENLSTHHAEGRLVIRPNRFWTTASSYWRLPFQEPSLKEDLDSSELVIFKGDLNYRKLTGDAMWDPTTPFKEAIGHMNKGCRVLALRTCKADVVVGLEPGVDESLRMSEDENGTRLARKWAWSGKYAVVQFSDGKAEGV